MGTPVENPKSVLAGDQETGGRTAMESGENVDDVAYTGKGAGPTLGFRSRFLVVQNAIGIVLSVPVLATGIYLARKNGGAQGGQECATFMAKPVVAMGALLLLVSLVGLLAVIVDKLSRALVLAWLHLLIMFCLTVLLFCFAIFSLDITNTDLAHTVHAYGQNYTEYRLYEYPKWMRRRVENPTYWSSIKLCLRKSASSVCDARLLLDFPSNFTHTKIYKLAPLQRGCCMPPSACNFTYGAPNQVEETSRKSAMHTTTLQHSKSPKETPIPCDISHQKGISNRIFNFSKIRRKNSATSPIHAMDHPSLHKTIRAYTHDCKNWEFTSNKLCYDCDTCRAAIIQSSMDKWRKAGELYVILVMVMILTYAFFSCYGFQKSQREK